MHAKTAQIMLFNVLLVVQWWETIIEQSDFALIFSEGSICTLNLEVAITTGGE